MSGVRDWFHVLGVGRASTSDEVRQAYYRLAKVYHPDTNRSNPRAADTFRDINTAYEVLKNEHSREKHLLELGVQGAQSSERVKSNYQRVHVFERIVHPRNLFVLLPIGLLAYAGMRSIIMRNDERDEHVDYVDAWFNLT
jgi:curved DNA-binding protein CbpA